MALLPIIIAPDPRLKLKCEVVDEVTDNIRKLIDNMLETMYNAPGIGLAAPQIGVTKRIIVVDVSKHDEDNQPYKMINPEIIWHSDELVDYEEGCLSLPKQYAEVIFILANGFSSFFSYLKKLMKSLTATCPNPIISGSLAV